jgi:hypothetical protein
MSFQVAEIADQTRHPGEWPLPPALLERRTDLLTVQGPDVEHPNRIREVPASTRCASKLPTSDGTAPAATELAKNWSVRTHIGERR